MKLADKISFELIKWARGSGHEILIPNFYHGWYEMDLFRLTNTEYVIEYEIKISRSDFFNDFKKNTRVYLSGSYDYQTKLKHDMIANGEGKCNRFFFVVPKDLVSINEVPEHCGLIYYNESSDFYGNKYSNLTMVKNAPILHKNKTADFKKLAVSLSFREVNQRVKLQGFIKSKK